MNVKIRQDFLANTIGYFDEELQAYNLTMFLAIGFPLILILFSFLQFKLYQLYNRKFHPFAEMARPKIKGKLIDQIYTLNILLQHITFTVRPVEEPKVILTGVSNSNRDSE